MFKFGDKIKLDLKKLFDFVATEEDKFNGFAYLDGTRLALICPNGRDTNYYWIDVGYLYEGYKDKEECLFFCEYNDCVWIIGNDLMTNDEQAPLIKLTKEQFKKALIKEEK